MPVKKKVKKTKTFELSADPVRLQELANHKFVSTLEAELFFKGMVATGIAMWMVPDPRTEEEEIILTDTLAALMYVLV
jgi:hypothetical protein